MCDKPFFDKATLNRHIRVKHDFSEVHICPVCNKSYSRERHLKIDLKFHEEIKSEFKNKAKHLCFIPFDLKRHKAEVHKLVNDTRMMNNSDDVEVNKNVKENKDSISKVDTKAEVNSKEIELLKLQIKEIQIKSNNPLGG